MVAQRMQRGDWNDTEGAKSTHWGGFVPTQAGANERRSGKNAEGAKFYAVGGAASIPRRGPIRCEMKAMHREETYVRN